MSSPFCNGRQRKFVFCRYRCRLPLILGLRAVSSDVPLPAIIAPRRLCERALLPGTPRGRPEGKCTILSDPLDRVAFKDFMARRSRLHFRWARRSHGLDAGDYRTFAPPNRRCRRRVRYEQQLCNALLFYARFVSVPLCHLEIFAPGKKPQSTPRCSGGGSGIVISNGIVTPK